MKINDRYSSFSWFCQFYWYFIQGFGKIAGPLFLIFKTIRSADNFLLLMVKNAEVDSNGDDCKDKTIKRLPSKNLNRATSYLISNAK